MTDVKSVTSRSNPQWQRLRRLAQDPSAYRRQGEVWIEGEHLCAAFVARGGMPSAAVIDAAALRRIAPTLPASCRRSSTTLGRPAPISPAPGQAIA